MKRPSTAPRRGRRGFILIIVLGLTVVVTALGMSFMESNSTAMPEAMNRSASVRARYLAESGIALGMHYLMYPPTTVATGEYWKGGTGIAIDLTNDYTDVLVSQDATDESVFTITATGIAKDPDGSVRGKKSSAAEVIVPDDGKWHISYGLLGTTMDIPATVAVQGDIHANGNLNGLGYCVGNVSASGVATWPGTGPPASVTSGADLVARPPADPALYAAYNIRGDSYTAYAYSSKSIDSGQASSLNAIDMSATNPGRVIIAKQGNFELKQDGALTGTLIVEGDLKIRKNVVLTALPGYPALVVTGDILMADNDMVSGINGSVICGGAIDDGDKQNVSLKIMGACIAGNGFNFARTNGAYVLTWDQNMATFWDFQKSSEQSPITILSWKED